MESGKGGPFGCVIVKDGKIMGLFLPDGGHLSHGFENNGKNISATSSL